MDLFSLLSATRSISYIYEYTHTRTLVVLHNRRGVVLFPKCPRRGILQARFFSARRKEERERERALAMPPLPVRECAISLERIEVLSSRFPDRFLRDSFFSLFSIVSARRARGSLALYALERGIYTQIAHACATPVRIFFFLSLPPRAFTRGICARTRVFIKLVAKDPSAAWKWTN